MGNPDSAFCRRRSSRAGVLVGLSRCESGRYREAAGRFAGIWNLILEWQIALHTAEADGVRCQKDPCGGGGGGGVF